MSRELDRPAAVRGAAVVSLVALVACALTSDALAGRLPADPVAGGHDISSRVAAIAGRIRAVEPTVSRELPPEAKIAQWRNR